MGSLLIKTLVLVGVMLLATDIQASHSNITSDKTLGTTVTLNGKVYNITDGTRRGNNLFHSFWHFILGHGDETASFNGPSGIRNIISRVTGGEQSFIDGLLRSTIDGANLFFINPAGVMFGPNAKLDVNGSFHVSTANYLKFADGAKFFADMSPLPTSGLTTDPAAFGFLGPTAGRISIEKSFLRVPDGQTLSVVGGDVEIKGATLTAPGGRVQIASVASEGEVPLSGEFNVSSFARLGRIDISENALIGASEVIDDIGRDSGTVIIRGGRLMVDDSRILAHTPGDVAGARLIDIQVAEDIALTNGASISSRTTVAERGGDVRITAGSLEMQKSAFIETATFGVANAGDISADVGKLTLTGGAKIVSSTRRSVPVGPPGGRGGNVTLRATDSATISGQGSGLFSNTNLRGGAGGQVTILTSSLTLDDGGTIATNTFSILGAAGRGGNIVVDVRRLSVTGGATISSFIGSNSPGGEVIVTATDSAAISGQNSGIFSSSCPGCTGRVGDITLNVGKFTLTGGAEISSGFLLSNTHRGGNITVTATDSAVISNGSSIRSRNFSEDVSEVTISAPSLTMDNGVIEASTIGGGRGGEISVNVDRLTLRSGAQIISSSKSQALGPGGDVTVRGYGGGSADSVSISGGSGIFSNAEGRGAGGNITVRAGKVDLDNGTISARSTSTLANAGDAGTITIHANTLRSRHSSVTTQAENAGGGKIEIKAQKMVHLVKSEITTAVRSGAEGAGDISIDPQFVILDRSRISADAFGGPGGNVTIVGDIFLNSRSLITASSALSTPGRIDIQASITDLSGSLAQLPEEVLEAATLLRASCAARLSGGKASSLVVGGREGLPLEPGGLLPSPLFMEGPMGLPSAGQRLAQERPSSRFSLLGLKENRLWSGNQHRLPKAGLTLGCSS